MTSIDIPSGTASLRDASARSAIALPGWGAVAFGALFVVAGAGVIEAARRALPVLAA